MCHFLSLYFGVGIIFARVLLILDEHDGSEKP